MSEMRKCKLKASTVASIFLTGIMIISGCGGSSPVENENRPHGFGTALISVSWPDVNESGAKYLIPLNAKSIVITVVAQNGTVNKKTISKAQVQQKELIENIPAGKATFIAQAFSSEDGSGDALATTPSVDAEVTPYPGSPVNVILEFSGSVLEGYVYEGKIRCPGSKLNTVSATIDITVCDVTATTVKIHGATIAVSETGAQIVSDAAGYYRVQVPVGNVHISVSKQGFRTRQFGVDVLQPSKKYDVALPRTVATVTVKGQLSIYDPYAFYGGDCGSTTNYMVKINELDRISPVDEHGTFTFEGVYPGVYTFSAFRDGFLLGDKTMAVKSDGMLDESLRVSCAYL